MASRRDFLGQPAPENYVAGLGRGATGFTTRSDLGPAREGPSDEQIKAAVAKRSAQLGLTEAKNDDKDDDDARYQDPENEVALFAGGIYTKDDEEADQIWDEIDKKLGKRRQKQREAREEAEREEYERKNPKIQQQFAGLKRALASVTDEEWASLPDAKDMTGRAKRARHERHQRFYAVPDSVLAAGTGQFGTTVADDGTATSNGENGTVTDFAKIGAARDKVLKSRLEQASQSSVAGGSASSIDPRGYLTSLDSNQTAAQSIGDIEQFRKMLKSAIDWNPKQASSWIAAARLEYQAGKPVAARNLIARGCQCCPKSEDIWLESIHLNDGHNAKVIAAEAVKNIPNSVKLWVEGMKLEVDPRSKKKVIQLALDHNPESEALWKELVKLEEDADNARLLLAKATDLIPASLDLWLALARLETRENAKKVLNKAVKKLPNSYELWIAATRLADQRGDDPDKVMSNGVKFLRKQNALPKREVWIAEAEKCEDEEAFRTCNSIIKETLGLGLDEEDDRKEIWIEEAKSSANRGKHRTARAILDRALREFPNSKTLYLAAIELERSRQKPNDLLPILSEAVKACPHVELFWLMLAKEKSGDIDEARRELGNAFKQNPDSEDIWLAAVKLEADNGYTDQARELLKTARQNAPTDRVWMRSVNFERQCGDNEAALDLVQGALRLFPVSAKLWMMKGQILEAMGKQNEARNGYGTGVKAVPSSVPLWLLYSRLEESSGNVVKARSVLDRARQAVPQSPELWCELIRVERRAGNLDQAKTVMATALKKMPRSGLLWTEQIMHLEERTKRKSSLAEALKKVETDPVLLVAAARIFWAERKLDKALNWFEKAIPLDVDCGDSFAWYYKFLLQHGTEEKRVELVKKCVQNDPRHGEHWQPIAKDPRNAGKGVEEVLKLVAASLSHESRKASTGT